MRDDITGMSTLNREKCHFINLLNSMRVGRVTTLPGGEFHNIVPLKYGLLLCFPFLLIVCDKVIMLTLAIISSKYPFHNSTVLHINPIIVFS